MSEQLNLIADPDETRVLSHINLVEQKINERFDKMGLAYKALQNEIASLKNGLEILSKMDKTRMYVVHPYRSENTNEIDKAHSAFLGECPNIFKDSQGRFKYASIEDCTKIINPLLGKHGLSVKQLDQKDEYGNPILITILSKDGQWYESRSSLLTEDGMKGVSTNQQFGSGMTYRRRYDLLAILNLASTDEADPDGPLSGATKAQDGR